MRGIARNLDRVAALRVATQWNDQVGQADSTAGLGHAGDLRQRAVGLLEMVEAVAADHGI